MSHILTYILATIGFIIAGSLWGFFRWSQFVDEELSYYERERQRFLIFHRIRGEEIPDFLHFEWRDAVQKNERLREVPPQTNKYRGEITFDVVLWPLSVLSLLVQTVFSVFIQRILAAFNKVTETKIAKVRRDLKRGK